MSRNLTPAMVQEWISELESLTHDPVLAHKKEDHIRGVVLLNIAMGTCVNPMQCARLARSTTKISFERWYYRKGVEQ